MKTLHYQISNSFKYIIEMHQKINSWVAKLLGPTVFKPRVKPQGWNINTQQLINFPLGTVGKALGEFLKQNNMEPLAKAEYHDVQHILFGFSMSFVDEVALQFFLRGNGLKSIASELTYIGAWFILPFHWTYLKSSYLKGQQYKDVSVLNNKTILQRNLKELKQSLLK